MALDLEALQARSLRSAEATNPQAAFLAHAGSDITQLVAEVRRLRGFCEQWVGLEEEWQSMPESVQAEATRLRGRLEEEMHRRGTVVEALQRVRSLRAQVAAVEALAEEWEDDYDKHRSGHVEEHWFAKGQRRCAIDLRQALAAAKPATPGLREDGVCPICGGSGGQACNRCGGGTGAT